MEMKRFSNSNSNPQLSRKVHVTRLNELDALEKCSVKVFSVFLRKAFYFAARFIRTGNKAMRKCAESLSTYSDFADRERSR